MLNIYHSPLRYPGGKNCIFPFMSKLFYDNQLLGSNYAEPYAGGAGLALRLLFEGYVEHIYINDLDRSIYTFWKCVVERSDELCDWLRNVDVNIQNWQRYREIQDHSSEAEDLDLAKSTFFLNRTNVSGIIKGGVIGGQMQTGKYKIDARFNKIDLIGRLQNISRVNGRISVSNLDGLAFIDRLNRKIKDIFIYIDPPYYQKGADLYMNFYSAKDHVELSKKVHKINKSWLVSYDYQEYILGLYHHFDTVSYRLSQSASNRVGEEILIFSPGLDYLSSINKLKTPALIKRTTQNVLL